MKGLIPVTATQTPDGIFWPSQDQNYVPRLLNYLKIDYSDYEWETVPGYDLTPEKIAEYEAVAVTSMSQRYFPLIKQAKPSIKAIKIGAEDFMRQMAPKGAVVGRTTGYVLVDNQKMSQKNQPKNPMTFNYENLRQVMRDYPKIYWEVVTFDELKERLRKNTKNVTVGLIPKTYAYEKYLQTGSPDVAIVKLTPKQLEKTPVAYEAAMLITGAITMVLMTLRVFF